MKVEQSLMTIDRYISRCWREHPEIDCKLTYTEYDYLQTLAESGSIRLSELAVLMRVSKPTASNMVARLEQKQLVKRQPCSQDRRSINVSLCTKGQTLLDNDHRFYSKLVSRLLTHLSEDDQKHLEVLLEKVAVKSIKA